MFPIRWLSQPPRTPPKCRSGHRLRQARPRRCGQAHRPRGRRLRGRRGPVRSPWRWRCALPAPPFHANPYPSGIRDRRSWSIPWPADRPKALRTAPQRLPRPGCGVRSARGALSPRQRRQPPRCFLGGPLAERRLEIDRAMRPYYREEGRFGSASVGSGVAIAGSGHERQRSQKHSPTAGG